ncbi:PAS domain-containing protein [Pseudoalteromonas fenneropenaei]|uniref:histidine kinase n=1 Tax=Pseudoalteromonas fenneropenaei TaxID=1737459 RepID=A0ABV7CNM3_9GAMM
MEVNSLKSFFSSAYMPHGHCYLWQDHILWTNVLSDLMIATAYFSIPIAIMIFAKRRKEVGYQGVFVLFSAFIMLCGLTHLMGIYTVWHGTYGMQGLMKAATATVSMVTAVYLFKLIPEALKLPSPMQYQGVQSQLREANSASEELKTQLAEHQITQFMLDVHPAGTLLINHQLEIVNCNPALLNELHVSDKQQLIGQSLFAILQLDDSSVNLSAILAEPNSETLLHHNALCHAKLQQGQSVPMALELVRARYQQQDMILITLQNLSHQRRIEQQLLDHHQHLERVINATEDGIWEWDVRDNSVTYSHTFMTMIGAQHITSPSFDDWFEHIHPDYRAKVLTAINTHFAEKKQYEVEYLGRNQEGSYGWFHAVGNSQFDAEGSPIVMSGSLRYIHNKKLLESQVAEKTEILNAIYNGSKQAIWLLRVEDENEFIFTEYNETAAERSGIAVDVILHKSLSDLSGTAISPELAEKFRHNYSRCVQAKAPIEYMEMLPYLGEPRWYQTTLYPLLEHQQVVKIVGTAIDITTRVEVEEALEHNQLFLEKIINSAVCGLYLYDLKEHRTIRINQRYTDLLGYDIHDLHAMEPTENCFHPEEQSLIQNHIANINADQSGKLIPIKYRYLHKQGHWVWCYAVDTVVSFDANKQPQLMLGTFVDVTEETQLLLKLQESNAQLEQFAFVASHDLQEPLRKITAFSDSLQSRLKPMLQTDEKARFELDRLLNAAQRMRVMIQDLLKLSRLHSTHLNLTNTTLAKVLQDTQEQLSYALEESSAVIRVNNGDLEFYADHSLLIQVMQNLIANSLKFRNLGIQPEIIFTISEKARFVQIDYEDNGLGIEEKYYEQVFEPFRRLNQQSQYAGSGMGLAICRQIIKLHRGKLQCLAPTAGQGAHFCIQLPRKEVTT